MAFLLLNFTALVYSQGKYVKIRETNPNYQEGDWISYSVARYVTSVAVGDQYVYFGTLQSGITRYDVFRNSWEYPWTTSNGLADNEVWAVAYDFDTGFVWCATHVSISYYQPSAHRWRNFFKDEFGLLVSDEVESIGIASNKIIFETRGGRIFETNKYGGIILFAASNEVKVNSRGKIRWFGRRAQTLKRLPHFFMTDGYLFDPGGYIEDRHGRRAEITAYVKDKWGNLWLGTWGLGAARGDLNTFRLEILEFGLANPSVHALNFYRDVLWMGGGENFTRDKGITAWDLNRGIWEHFEDRFITDLDSDLINAITVDGDTVWFATRHGLSLYSYKKNRWRTFDSFDGLSDNLVYDVVTDKTSVWVATANGIDRIFKKNLKKSKKDSLKIQHLNRAQLFAIAVYDLELIENLLWAATNHGLYVYDIAKNVGGFSTELEVPVSSVITSISKNGDEIWLGTLDGVAAYNFKTHEWYGTPEKLYLPHTPVNRILATEKAVWVATNQGVMKFNRKSKTWRTFNMEDGLIDDRVYALLMDGDYLWIGTERGITQFFWNDPHRID